MTKRFILAALTAMLAIAVMGGVLYGVVFASFFRANIIDLSIMKSPPAFGWIALSHVPFGILLALVVRWRGELSARGGAMAGAVLGLLMAMSYNLAQFGTVEPEQRDAADLASERVAIRREPQRCPHRHVSDQQQFGDRVEPWHGCRQRVVHRAPRGRRRRGRSGGGCPGRLRMRRGEEHGRKFIEWIRMILHVCAPRGTVAWLSGR